MGGLGDILCDGGDRVLAYDQREVNTCTHTHTHTQRERERERDLFILNFRGGCWSTLERLKWRKWSFFLARTRLLCCEPVGGSAGRRVGSTDKDTARLWSQ
jgi:hypothetical protein